MANLKHGSTGDEVKQLQQALGFTGKDVDGIAGKNTLGKLYSNTNTNKTPAATPAAPKAPATQPANPAPSTPTTPDTSTTSSAGFTYGDFQYDNFDPMSDEQISQAWGILQQQQASKPGDWVDPYRDKYMGYLNQYENRDPFSYDFNSDALYQQYKDQYIQQGQMAMMDTMGQAAAMTGGYGNSYAQTVGQQAYNQQLNQLNNIMPELYQMAYDRYGQEGQEMLDMYNMYLGLSNQDYAMHQDSLNNWYQENALLTDQYNTLYDRAWDDYVLGYNTAYDDHAAGRSEAFNQWQAEQDHEFTASENEKNRLHTSEENEKSRAFTASENEKSRAASAAKGSGTGTQEIKYDTLDAVQADRWEKKLEKAQTISDVEFYVDQLADIIGPEAAARWYDRYAPKFINGDQLPTGVDPNEQKYFGGGAGGRWYMTTK